MISNGHENPYLFSLIWIVSKARHFKCGIDIRSFALLTAGLQSPGRFLKKTVFGLLVLEWNATTMLDAANVAA